MKKGWLQDTIDPFEGLGMPLHRNVQPYGGIDSSDPAAALMNDRTGLYGYRDAHDFLQTKEGPDPLYNDQPYGFSQFPQDDPNTEMNIRNAGYGYLLDVPLQDHAKGGLRGLLSHLFKGR